MHAAFRREMGGCANALTLHEGMSPDQTGARLRGIPGDPGDAWHLYVCDPGPMIEATRSIAASQGWDDAAIHFDTSKTPPG